MSVKTSETAKFIGSNNQGRRTELANSKITLSSSINSSTKELLQLIQNHPRDSVNSNYAVSLN